MRRLLLGFVLLATLSICLPAQEAKTDAKEAKEEHGEMLGWKWANFGLLALGLGYLLGKNLPPFFRSRTEEIQRGMQEAGKLKADAEARAAAIEGQLANVASEIERLRTELRAEMSIEGQRIEQETAKFTQRIKEQAEQEIAFLTKAGRQELKAFSASLALDLAQDRIRSRMNPGTQTSLVDAFVQDMHHENGKGIGAQ